MTDTANGQTAQRPLVLTVAVELDGGNVAISHNAGNAAGMRILLEALAKSHAQLTAVINNGEATDG